MAAIAAPIKATIHIYGPLKNKARAIPVSTELYPNKPWSMLFLSAPPSFPTSVPMMEDNRAMIPK